MSFRVVIEEEAEQEFIEAVDFYDLHAFFETVCKNPERFRLVTRLTHKARLPKPWPYSVFFAIKRETSEVIISTIWHDSRNPAALRRRMK